MTDLSQEDQDIIKQYPLNDSLDNLVDLLQDAEHVYSSRQSYDDAVDPLDHLYRRTISKLLYALLEAEAAIYLRSGIRERNIGADLYDLFTRLRREETNFNYDHYRALIQLVIHKSSDINIWKAVRQLLDTISRLTPPETAPPTFGGTPWRSSSSSQRNEEQTRELVEARLFDEIRTCTHKNVEGFDAKYFHNAHWEEEFSTIYKKIQENDTDLSDFPEPSIQSDVLDWWFRFQTNFLTETRGIYFSTESKKDLKGSQADRQLDILMKARMGGDSGSQHDWKDILVIGKLKQSNYDKKGTLLQMLRYIRDIFAAQPTRPFVHSFSLCGTEMEMWVTDRSGLYSSGSFDIRKEPERFFRAIIGYTLMSDKKLGLDTFITLQDDGTRSISIEDIQEKKVRQLRLDSTPIFIQLAVVCRGTCCYLTKPCDISSSQSVAKFSWVSDRRRSEIELLRVARQRGVEGVAKVVGYNSIMSIAELRQGLGFNKIYRFRSAAPSASLSSSQSQSQNNPSQPLTALSGSSRKRKRSSATEPLKRSRPSNLRFEIGGQESAEAFSMKETQKASLYATDGERTFDNRILRCLVISPAGRAINKFDSPRELIQALRDAIRAHRSLYFKGRILHRDISENNIIITDPQNTNGYSGMLIDLDLAKELDSGPTGARHQTGTMEFMAIEVLRNIDHTYRHDLESFLYVLLWQCARTGWKRYDRWDERPKKSRLKKWYTGNYEDIADAKMAHMDVNVFEQLLREFPPEFHEVKQLCRELRESLFPYCRGLVTGTPVKPETLYDPIIHAFDEAIEGL